MKTNKMKTNELIDDALDWAVAKCGGYFDEQPEYWATVAGVKHFTEMRSAGVHWARSSTDWEEGGPIIEREKIATAWHITRWVAWRGVVEHPGPTPLIAAMRCFVASKLGNDIEIPEELK